MPFDNTCLYPEKFSGFSFSKKLQKYLVVSKTFPTFVPLKYNLCDNSRPFEGFFYALTIHIRLSFSKFFVFARVIFKQREQAAVFNFLPKCLKITNMSTTTIQLTPKVATVPTSKALHFFNEAVSGLFNQSIFLHCEKQVSDDEIIVTLRDSFVNVTLNIQSAEMPVMEGGVA